MNPVPFEAGRSPSQQPLTSLLERLESLSLEPEFRLQREQALYFFLKPYFSPQYQGWLAPLPEEVELAKLALYADYLPTDGHPSLIEQARDQIINHLPEDARAWLDPLRHSYMDVLEILAIGSSSGADDLHLRSLGDEIEYVVRGGDFAGRHHKGQILVTRLIQRPEYTAFPGVAVTLSQVFGNAYFETVKELQVEMEATSGVFDWGNWPEFAKRFGHVLLWAIADIRTKGLLVTETNIRYVTVHGEPLLYAVALYEHNQYSLYASTLAEIDGWELQRGEGSQPGVNTEIPRVWVQRQGPSDNGHPSISARLTLTPTMLWVECDSAERLNDVKHELASCLGYALHFRGESVERPRHVLQDCDLEAEEPPTRIIQVSEDEERRLLSQFLETVYVDWTEKPCPALRNQFPRQYAVTPERKQTVAQIIDEREREDLCRRRTGTPGYDYNILRAHVGLG